MHNIISDALLNNKDTITIQSTGNGESLSDSE